MLREYNNSEVVRHAWDLKSDSFYYNVPERARDSHRTTHFGRAFGTCVEKGSELRVGDLGWKFKGVLCFKEIM